MFHFLNSYLMYLNIYFFQNSTYILFKKLHNNIEFMFINNRGDVNRMTMLVEVEGNNIFDDVNLNRINVNRNDVNRGNTVQLSCESNTSKSILRNSSKYRFLTELIYYHKTEVNLLIHTCTLIRTLPCFCILLLE